MLQLSGIRPEMTRKNTKAAADLAEVDSYRNSFHHFFDKYHQLPISLHLQMQDLLLIIKLTMGLYDFVIWY